MLFYHYLQPTKIDDEQQAQFWLMTLAWCNVVSLTFPSYRSDGSAPIYRSRQMSQLCFTPRGCSTNFPPCTGSAMGMSEQWAPKVDSLFLSTSQSNTNRMNPLHIQQSDRHPRCHLLAFLLNTKASHPQPPTRHLRPHSHPNITFAPSCFIILNRPPILPSPFWPFPPQPLRPPNQHTFLLTLWLSH